jgi:cytidine deaminase
MVCRAVLPQLDREKQRNQRRDQQDNAAMHEVAELLPEKFMQMP